MKPACVHSELYRKGSAPILILLAVLAILILSVTGYYYLKATSKPKSNATSSSNSAITQSSNLPTSSNIPSPKIADIAGWTKYANGSLTFQYPADWTLKETNSVQTSQLGPVKQLATLQSKDFMIEPPPRSITQGIQMYVTKISYNNPDNLTLLDWLHKKLPLQFATSEKEISIPGSEKSYRIEELNTQLNIGYIWIYSLKMREIDILDFQYSFNGRQNSIDLINKIISTFEIL